MLHTIVRGNRIVWMLDKQQPEFMFPELVTHYKFGVDALIKGKSAESLPHITIALISTCMDPQSARIHQMNLFFIVQSDLGRKPSTKYLAVENSRTIPPLISTLIAPSFSNGLLGGTAQFMHFDILGFINSMTCVTQGTAYICGTLGYRALNLMINSGYRRTVIAH